MILCTFAGKVVCAKSGYCLCAEWCVLEWRCMCWRELTLCVGAGRGNWPAPSLPLFPLPLAGEDWEQSGEGHTAPPPGPVLGMIEQGLERWRGCP